MTKTFFVFTVLIIFIVAAVWFVIKKTGEVNQSADISYQTEEQATGQEIENTNNEENVENEVIQYDNGLIVQDVVVGEGKEAETGDKLSAHYVGMLEDGTVFDESYSRGQPIEFVLGSGQLIQGWELGLVGMREGGKRRLIIPSDLGYGERGAGNAIPPNSNLLFEIELVSVTKK